MERAVADIPTSAPSAPTCWTCRADLRRAGRRGRRHGVSARTAGAPEVAADGRAMRRGRLRRRRPSTSRRSAGRSYRVRDGTAPRARRPAASGAGVSLVIPRQPLRANIDRTCRFFVAGARGQHPVWVVSAAGFDPHAYMASTRMRALHDCTGRLHAVRSRGLSAVQRWCDDTLPQAPWRATRHRGAVLRRPERVGLRRLLRLRAQRGDLRHRLLPIVPARGTLLGRARGRLQHYRALDTSSSNWSTTAATLSACSPAGYRVDPHVPAHSELALRLRPRRARPRPELYETFLKPRDGLPTTT